MTGAALAAALAAGLAGAWLARQVTAMLAAGGLLTRNYQGRSLPRPLGLALVPAYLAGAAAGSLVLGRPWVETFPYLAALAGMGFFGFTDDVLGRDQHGGLRGHASALLKTGRLTGGGMKALGGGLLALVLAGAGRPPPGLLVDAGLVALGANAVNLLDLRPGRALYAFWAVTVVIAVAAINPAELPPLIPLLSATAALAPWDLGARAMLGDTGANALGAAAGLFAVRALSPAGREVGLVLLVVLHLGAEFGSITRFLEGRQQPLQGRRSGGSDREERNSPPPEE